MHKPSIKNEDQTLAPYNHRLIADWLDTWGAQVALTLTAEELSSFSPSVSNFPAKVFSILGGLTLSSDATRVGELDYYFTVKELQSKGPCSSEDMAKNANSDYPVGSPLIYSDLKLAEWLSSVVFIKLTGDFPTTDPTNKNAKNGITHHVTFKIVTSGNVNPSWKLVDATINPLIPWFMANRTRSNDLLITLGPNIQDKNPVTGETTNSIGTNTPAAYSNLAAQIGIAIRNQTLNSNMP